MRNRNKIATLFVMAATDAAAAANKFTFDKQPVKRVNSFADPIMALAFARSWVLWKVELERV